MTVTRLAILTGFLSFAAVMAQKTERPPEEEDDKPPPPVIRPDDPMVPPKPAAKPIDVNLASEARRTKHPGIKQLFSSLAIPYDIVELKGPPQHEESVEPLPVFIGSSPNTLKTDKVELKELSQDLTKVVKPRTIGKSAVIQARHYEQRAEQAVDEFLAKSFETLPPTDPNHLALADKLLAGEQALTAVAREHDSMVRQGRRQGDGWEKLRDSLEARLLRMTVERLRTMTEKKDWEGAITLASGTTRRFRKADFQKAIAEPLVKLIAEQLAQPGDAKYRDVLLRLRQVEETLPYTDATKPIRDELIRLARPLFDQAQKLLEDKKQKEAEALIVQGEAICPFYPGLRLLRIVPEGEQPLNVGFRDLPLNLSPALAFTESERQAVELIFESLYEMAPDADGGRFRPVLARGRPRLLPLGREVSLPRDAQWSDGKPIRAADVVSTINVLKSDWPGRVPSWIDDVLDVPQSARDPFSVVLTLRQGCLDPLAMMNFKILPSQSVARPDNPDFARKPVGSGPYMLDSGQFSHDGRPYRRFVANPYFRNRPDADGQSRDGQPRIHEVRFFESNIDPVGDMTKGAIDVLPDVPPASVSALKKLQNVSVVGPLPTRRIYMLAVNNTRKPLDNALVRRALAKAVPRETLLRDSFRADLGDKVHQPLYGPFPALSWATPRKEDAEPETRNPAEQLQQDERDLNSAKSLLAESKEVNIKLELKYPLGDAATAKAMEALAKRLKDGLKIDVTPRPVTLQNLQDDVERTRTYDLAYYWYEYPDPTYSLFPLLDSRSIGIGGRNFLGYNETSGQLENLCRDAMRHRNFKEVQELTTRIHRVFVGIEMPFIPLWQLDRFLAFNSTVQVLDGYHPVELKAPNPPFDPLRVFQGIEYWQVKKK